MRNVIPRRSRRLGLLAGVVSGGGLAVLAACNGLTGVDDLTTATCSDCGPAQSSGGIDGQASGEGGFIDGSLDGPFVPKPGGFLDPTFGKSGVVISELLDTVTSIAIQGDGKLVVAGASEGRLAVVRFDAAGVRDESFGSDARVIAATLTSSRADAVVVDSQGRILAGGVAVNVDGTTNVTTQFGYVVRVTSAGPDATFGVAGRKTFSTDGEAVTSLVVLAADAYLAGGRAPSAEIGTVGAIWQLSATGAFVPINGQTRAEIVFSLAAPSTITAMMGGGGQSVVAVGSVTPLLGTSDFAAARFVGGGFDPTFGGNGRVVVSLGANADTGLATAMFPDGTYLAGGEVAVTGGGLFNRTPQLGLARLQGDGSLKTSWASGGKAIVKFELPGQLLQDAGDHLRGVAVDKQGRVIVVGYTEEKATAGPNKRRAVALRLDANGQNDFFFGSFGIVGGLFDATSIDARASAVALQADGKIVVAGTSSGRLALARITP